jgi:anti-sigma B factor antagonist
MPTQDCQIRWVGPHAVAAVPAEIDAANAERIRQGLLPAASLGAAVVVIDMSETTFCDSAGVQPIIAAYRQAAANGTQLPLVATAVLRILTLVGVGQLLPIYPTLEAALAGTPPAHASTPDPGDEHGGTTASGDPQAQTRRPRRSTVVSRDFGASAEAGWPKTYQNDRYVALNSSGIKIALLQPTGIWLGLLAERWLRSDHRTS